MSARFHSSKLSPACLDPTDVWPPGWVHRDHYIWRYNPCPTREASEIDSRATGLPLCGVSATNLRWGRVAYLTNRNLRSTAPWLYYARGNYFLSYLSWPAMNASWPVPSFFARSPWCLILGSFI